MPSVTPVVSSHLVWDNRLIGSPSGWLREVRRFFCDLSGRGGGCRWAVVSQPPFITACLIVRDEEQALPGCLASLSGRVDAVVVHDTGSTDSSVEIALAAGCTVVRGSWEGNFSRARDVALVEARRLGHDGWVLSIDADERLHGDVRAAASMGVRALSLEVRNTTATGSYTHVATRLFVLAGTRWQGRVHEQVTDRSGRLLAAAAVPADLCRLEHTGYATAAAERAKGARNAALAAEELAGTTDPRRVGRLRLDLARSLLAAGRTQESLDALLHVRDSTEPGCPDWCSATDFITRILLAAGEHQLACDTAEDLRRYGGPADYCDWLVAQALAQLGRADEAYALLEPLARVVDPDGREHDLGLLHETRALAALLSDRPDRAADDLVVAMARHGRVAGRGPLAAEVWRKAGRSASQLWLELDREAADPGVRALLADERPA